MRQFALYIDDEVKGPFSEYEVQDMIHAGKATAETLCAPAGSQDWEPLSNHFSFGSNLKLTRRTTEKPANAAETEPALPRLDHDVRRRLLMYGLADAASVDQISPAQAEVLIRETESRIRRQLLVRKASTYLSLAAGAAGAWIGLAAPASVETLGSIADSLVKQDAKATGRWEMLCRRARDFEAGVATATQAEFGVPPGGMSAGPILLSRLQVSEETAYNVSTRVTLNPETLVGPLSKFGITLEPKLTVHLLASDLPTDVVRKVKAQGDTLQLVISPMLDNAQFEPLREELLAKFPDAQDIPESARLRSDLASVKVGELGLAAEKVLFRARDADAIAEGKGSKSSSGPSPKSYGAWAGRLRDFANQINLLRDQIRINVEPDARRKVWSDFNLGPGAELAAWVLARSPKAMQTDENGDIRLAETSNLRADTMLRRALVSLRVNEDTVFLPWDSPFLVTGEVASTRVPNDTFLARERYKVVSLIEAGGKRHAYRLEVGNKTLAFFRDAPKAFYLSLAREKDTDVLTFRVPEAMFKAAKRGDLIPIDTLLTLPVHATPADPAAPSCLSLES